MASPQPGSGGAAAPAGAAAGTGLPAPRALPALPPAPQPLRPLLAPDKAAKLAETLRAYGYPLAACQAAVLQAGGDLNAAVTHLVTTLGPPTTMVPPVAAASSPRPAGAAAGAALQASSNAASTSPTAAAASTSPSSAAVKVGSGLTGLSGLSKTAAPPLPPSSSASSSSLPAYVGALTRLYAVSATTTTTAVAAVGGKQQGAASKGSGAGRNGSVPPPPATAAPPPPGMPSRPALAAAAAAAVAGSASAGSISSLAAAISRSSSSSSFTGAPVNVPALGFLSSLVSRSSSSTAAVGANVGGTAPTAETKAKVAAAAPVTTLASVKLVRGPARPAPPPSTTTASAAAPAPVPTLGGSGGSTTSEPKPDAAAPAPSRVSKRLAAAAASSAAEGEGGAIAPPPAVIVAAPAPTGTVLRPAAPGAALLADASTIVGLEDASTSALAAPKPDLAAAAAAAAGAETPERVGEALARLTAALARASTPGSGGVAGALPELRRVTSLLLLLLPPPSQAGLPRPVLLPHHKLLASVPTATLQSVIPHLRAAMAAGVGGAEGSGDASGSSSARFPVLTAVCRAAAAGGGGRASSSGAGSELPRATATAAAALEAALAYTLLAAAPGVDTVLVQEDAVASVLALVRATLTGVFFPAADAFDPAWAVAANDARRAAAASGSGAAAGAGAAAASASRPPSRGASASGAGSRASTPRLASAAASAVQSDAEGNDDAVGTSGRDGAASTSGAMTDGAATDAGEGEETTASRDGGGVAAAAAEEGDSSSLDLDDGDDGDDAFDSGMEGGGATGRGRSGGFRPVRGGRGGGRGGRGGGSSRPSSRASGGGASTTAGPIKVLKAHTTAIQAAARQLLGPLVALLTRWTDLLPRLGSEGPLLAQVMAVAVMAATQCNAVVGAGSAAVAAGAAGSRGGAPGGGSAAATALGRAATPEAQLQTCAMGLLQALFEQAPSLRSPLLLDVLAAHVRITAAKRAAPGFPVPLLAPRPHLQAALADVTAAAAASTGGGGHNNSGAAAGGEVSAAGAATLASMGVDAAAAAAAAASGASSSASAGTRLISTFLEPPVIFSCTAVVVHLLQGAAAPPLAVGEGAASASAVSASAAASTDTASSYSSSSAPGTSGHLALQSLATRYSGALVNWVVSQYGGGGGGGGGLGGEGLGKGASSATASDDDDPRLVLRRYCMDLLSVFDLPQWPAAEALLYGLASKLVGLLPKPAALVRQWREQGNAALADAAASWGRSEADRALGPIALQLLCLIAARCHVIQTFVSSNALELPPPRALADPRGAPGMAGEDASCLCGRGVLARRHMLDCDGCHRWFHIDCVGLDVATAEGLARFECDECRIRGAVLEQHARFKQCSALVAGGSSSGGAGSTLAAAAADAKARTKAGKAAAAVAAAAAPPPAPAPAKKGGTKAAAAAASPAEAAPAPAKPAAGGKKGAPAPAPASKPLAGAKRGRSKGAKEEEEAEVQEALEAPAAAAASTARGRSKQAAAAKAAEAEAPPPAPPAAKRAKKGEAGEAAPAPTNNKPSSKTTAATAEDASSLDVFRQLVLNFVSAGAHEDAFTRMGRRFLVARWAHAHAAEAARAAAVAASGSNTTAATTEATALPPSAGEQYYASQWLLPERGANPSSSASSSSATVLSPHNTMRAWLQLLAQESPLLLSLDTLFTRVLTVYESDQAKLRAGLMRGLVDVLGVSPSLLDKPAVAGIIAARLADSSRLVRAEALDLLGRYISNDRTSPSSSAPSSTSPLSGLQPRYFDMLLETLRDEGVSVRKKTVSILRGLLFGGRLSLEGAEPPAGAVAADNPVEVPSSLSTPRQAAEAGEAGLAPSIVNVPLVQRLAGALAASSPPLLLPASAAPGQQTTAVVHLLDRASDGEEEDSVRDAVHDTLTSLWFARPEAAGVWRTAKTLAVLTAQALAGSSEGEGGAGASVSPATWISTAVSIEIRSRAAQILAVVEATARRPQGSAGASSPASSPRAWDADRERYAGYGIDRLGAALRGLMGIPEDGHVPSDSPAGRVPLAPGAWTGSAATEPGTDPAHVIPGVGPWCPLAVGVAVVGYLVEMLLSLEDRRASLLASRAMLIRLIKESNARAKEAAVAGPVAADLAALQRSLTSRWHWACSVYERELLAVWTTLAVVGAAYPPLLGPHVSKLAPALKGAPPELVSTATAHRLMQCACVCLEVALPVVPSALPPALAAEVETDLLALLEGTSGSSSSSGSGAGGEEPVVLLGGAGGTAAASNSSGKPSSLAAAAAAARAYPLSVLQAAAGALGILTMIVTHSDIRVRNLANSLYARLLDVHTRAKTGIVSVLGGSGSSDGSGGAGAASSAPASAAGLPPSSWMRLLTPRNTKAPADFEDTLTALTGLGLLLRYCDVDGPPPGGAATSSAADEDDEEEAGEEEAGAGSRRRKGVKAAGGRRGAGAGRKGGKAQPTRRRGRAAASSEDASSYAPEDMSDDDDEEDGGDSDAAAGRGRGRKGRAGGGARRRRGASTDEAEDSSFHGSRSPSPASSDVSLPSRAGSVAAVDEEAIDFLPRGRAAVTVHSMILTYANAALEVARTAHVQARALVVKADARLTAVRTGAEPLPPGCPSYDALVRRTAESLAMPLEVLRGFETIAERATRALGHVYVRFPRFLLGSGFSGPLLTCFRHPLPFLRETALVVLRDLLTAQEDRVAVGFALAIRSRRDAELLQQWLLSGGTALDPHLLQSVTGMAMRTALIRSTAHLLPSSSGGALGAPSSPAGAGSGSWGNGAGSFGSPLPLAPPAASRTGGGGARFLPGNSPSLASPATAALKGRPAVLGDRDGDASIATGLVQAFFPLVNYLLYDATYDPLGGIPPLEAYRGTGGAPLPAGPGPDLLAALHGGCGGRHIRLAAVGLMGVILRQGVRDPDSCAVPLVALSTDAAPAVASLALSHLRVLASRYPSRLELTAVAGVVESYRFLQAVAGWATARRGGVSVLAPFYTLLCAMWGFSAPGTSAAALLAGGEGAAGAVAPPPSSSGPPAPASGASGTNPAARAAFLRSLVHKVVPDTLPPFFSLPALLAGEPEAGMLSGVPPSLDLGLARYLAYALMFAPYTREDEPLTVVAYINRALALHGEGLVDRLASVAAGLAAGGPDCPAAKTLARPTGRAAATLLTHTALAVALTWLAAVKKYLKAAYDLKDARVAAFEPVTTNSAAAAGGYAALPTSTAGADVGSEGAATLPPAPAGLEAACTALVKAVKALRAGSAAAATGRGDSESGGGGAASSSSAAATPLTATLLNDVANTLQAALDEQPNDFSPRLPPLSATEKRRGAAGGGGGAGTKRVRATGGAGKAPKRAKKAAASSDDDDDEAVIVSSSGAGEGGAAPTRVSARAAARGRTVYAEEVSDDDDEGGGGGGNKKEGGGGTRRGKK